MNLAQINRLFMFLASTDIKTTDTYDSDIQIFIFMFIQNILLFVCRSCHGRLIKYANIR